MKSIILAAGKGERLRPCTNNVPKCQLPIAGRTLLDWQLEALRQCGISDVCIVKGYASASIPTHIRSYFNSEHGTTNMVASLFCASRELTEPCLVCYSDILYEPRVVATLLGADASDIAVAVDVAWFEYYQRRFVDPYAEAESLVVDQNYRIIEIGRSGPPRDAIQGQFIGLIRLSEGGARIFLDRFNKWRPAFWDRPWMRGRPLRKAFMTDFLQALIDDGVKIAGVPVVHGWLEFDSVRDYENVQHWFEAGTLNSLFSCRWFRPETPVT